MVILISVFFFFLWKTAKVRDLRGENVQSPSPAGERQGQNSPRQLREIQLREENLQKQLQEIRQREENLQRQLLETRQREERTRR